MSTAPFGSWQEYQDEASAARGSEAGALPETEKRPLAGKAFLVFHVGFDSYEGGLKMPSAMIDAFLCALRTSKTSTVLSGQRPVSRNGL